MTSIINASTTAGVIITPDTSGNLAFQSAGSNVAAIQSNGMTINTYTPSTTLITSGTAITTTSGTAATFTGIPSWVKRITVILNGISTGGSQYIALQIGSGGTLQGSGYSGNIGITTSAAGASCNSMTSSNFYIVNKYNASDVISGNCVLTLVSGNTWILSSVTAGINSAQYRADFAAGTVTLSGALNILSITDTTGSSFSSGSINILYE
jgi:hypothetical protein